MTADPTALRALADRVEMAEGPSRELDAEIDDALTWRGVWSFKPTFTGSLDDALALVPEGHRWAIKQKEDFYAGCWREIDGIGPSVIAATPALALTAASLRARAAMMEGGV